MLHKSQSYDVQFLRYRVRQTEFFAFLGHFSPFTIPHPPNDSQNQNFEKKMKRMPEDTILLYIHVHQKWRSYDIWFLKYKAQQTEIFVILGHFLPFYPTKNPKNQNFEKMKKTLEILSFYISVPKIMIICYIVPDMSCDRCNWDFSFWGIFCPFISLTAQKIKISKKWKNIQRYHHFTQVCQK